MAIICIGAAALVVGQFRSVVAGSTIFLRLTNRPAAVTFFGLAARLLAQNA